MAQIDKLIGKMVEGKVERAVLTNDQLMRLIIGGRETNGPAIIPLATVQGMVQEVIPANLQARLAQDGKFQFPYQAAQGIYNIAVERGNGKLQVSVTPLTPIAPLASRPQAVLPNLPANAPTDSPSLATSQVTFLPPQSSSKPINIGIIVAGLVGLLLLMFGGLWIRSLVIKSEQHQARLAAQVESDQKKSAYDQYMQQIQNLGQVGVNITRVPSDEHYANGSGDDYLIAKTDDATYNAAVQSLEKQIKADVSLEGSETAGSKADLLKVLKDESSRDSPFARATAINRKTCNQVYEIMTLKGKDSLKLPGVLNVVMSYKGMDGLKQLSQTDNNISFQQAASSMFKDASLMPIS